MSSLEKFMVNLLMYPKGLNIQQLNNNQIKFAWEFSPLGMFALEKFKINPLMYLSGWHI